jgi:hypothetical protein
VWPASEVKAPTKSGSVLSMAGGPIHMSRSLSKESEVKQPWREAAQRRRREAGAYMMRKLDLGHTKEKVVVAEAVAEADSSSKP